MLSLVFGVTTGGRPQKGENMYHSQAPSRISVASRGRIVRWLIGSPLKEIERELVLQTLVSTQGNRTVSARLLGISIRTLRNKIAEFSAQGIKVPAAGSGRPLHLGVEPGPSGSVRANLRAGMVLHKESLEVKSPLPSVDAAPPSS
jgi:hypothetical protein